MLKHLKTGDILVVKNEDLEAFKEKFGRCCITAGIASIKPVALDTFKPIPGDQLAFEVDCVNAREEPRFKHSRLSRLDAEDKKRIVDWRLAVQPLYVYETYYLGFVDVDMFAKNYPHVLGINSQLSLTEAIKRWFLGLSVSSPGIVVSHNGLSLRKVEWDGKFDGDHPPRRFYLYPTQQSASTAGMLYQCSNLTSAPVTAYVPDAKPVEAKPGDIHIANPNGCVLRVDGERVPLTSGGGTQPEPPKQQSIEALVKQFVEENPELVRDYIQALSNMENVMAKSGLTQEQRDALLEQLILERSSPSLVKRAATATTSAAVGVGTWALRETWNAVRKIVIYGGIALLAYKSYNMYQGGAFARVGKVYSAIVDPIEPVENAAE